MKIRNHKLEPANELRGSRRKGTETFSLRFLAIIFILLFVVLVSACSRTVTQIVTYGDTMTVEVTLRGTADVLDNRYFLVLGSNEALSLPLSPPDSTDEFLEPGDLPLEGSEEAYYTKYYSTWNGYIVMDSGGYFLVDGPFVYESTTTREVISSLGDLTNVISFNFRLGRVFQDLPNRVYFDFLCVPYPETGLKYAKDRLYPPLQNISTTVGSELSETNSPDDSIAADLDILSWKVTIQ